MEGLVVGLKSSSSGRSRLGRTILLIGLYLIGPLLGSSSICAFNLLLSIGGGSISVLGGSGLFEGGGGGLKSCGLPNGGG